MIETKNSSGKRIINYAKTLEMIIIVVFLLIGVGVYILFPEDNRNTGIVVGVIVFAGGFFAASILSMFMKGFGELVLNNACMLEHLIVIEKRLEGNAELPQKENNTQNEAKLACIPGTVEMELKPGLIRCPQCDTVQNSDRLVCLQCGYKGKPFAKG